MIWKMQEPAVVDTPEFVILADRKLMVGSFAGRVQAIVLQKTAFAAGIVVGIGLVADIVAGTATAAAAEVVLVVGSVLCPVVGTDFQVEHIAGVGSIAAAGAAEAAATVALDFELQEKVPVAVDIAQFEAALLTDSVVVG